VVDLPGTPGNVLKLVVDLSGTLGNTYELAGRPTRYTWQYIRIGG